MKTLDLCKPHWAFVRALPSVILVCCLSLSSLVQAANPRVAINTNHGVIEVELLQKLAPLTVTNFLDLVASGFYSDLIFHRVIANFMIQGGGYDQQISYVPGPKTVANESFNGIKNTKGTVAMARLSDPDSADTQFFINVKDNTHLDAAGSQAGYTVFGRISAGYEVVESIELVSTHLSHGMAAVPEELVIISSITLIE
ncbi:MAG: peptidylprolyl isomerase [Pseudomonadales bacterium]|nr:peptidylprolyl isomerase [Pseudomonadales bacterium]